MDKHHPYYLLALSALSVPPMDYPFPTPDVSAEEEPAEGAAADGFDREVLADHR